MNTYLGASSLLSVPDVDIDADTVAAGKVLYMEGYLYDRDGGEGRLPARRPGSPTRTGGWCRSRCRDSFCVDRHRDDFRSLVRDEVDLLFGNEDELLVALPDRQRSTTRSLRSARDCALAGDHDRRQGFLHRHARRRAARRLPTPCERVLDTTGAGDLFAAGFLFGYTQGRRSLQECGRLGSIAAAEVISHVGPRPLVGAAYADRDER